QRDDAIRRLDVDVVALDAVGRCELGLDLGRDPGVVDRMVRIVAVAVRERDGGGQRDRACDREGAGERADQNRALHACSPFVEGASNLSSAAWLDAESRTLPSARV